VCTVYFHHRSESKYQKLTTAYLEVESEQINQTKPEREPHPWTNNHLGRKVAQNNDPAITAKII